MGKTEFVTMPRDVLHDSVNGSEQEQGRARNKLRSLLEQPTGTHPGAPVAWAQSANLKASPNPDSRYPTKSVRDDENGYSVPLFAHADPGEAERLRNCLRTEIEAGDSWKKEAEKQRERISKRLIDLTNMRHERDTLRADVETMRRKNNEYWQETETLRAQLATEKARGTLLDDARIQAEELQWSAERKLAEREALLREVLEAFQLEPDGSCINPGRDFIRPWAAKVAALSASAEPSAPKYPRVEFVRAHKHTCANVQPGSTSADVCDCGAVVDGLPVPAERDERAAFEADWAARHGVVTDVGARNSFYRLQPLGRYRWPDVQNGWDAWQARAALSASAEPTTRGKN